MLHHRSSPSAPIDSKLSIQFSSAHRWRSSPRRPHSSLLSALCSLQIGYGRTRMYPKTPEPKESERIKTNPSVVVTMLLCERTCASFRKLGDPTCWHEVRPPHSTASQACTASSPQSPQRFSKDVENDPLGSVTLLLVDD